MPDCTVYKDIQAFFSALLKHFSLHLRHYFPWIADSMLEDIPAAYSQRQDTLLDHYRALSEHLEVWYLAKGHPSIVLKVSWTLSCVLPFSMSSATGA